MKIIDIAEPGLLERAFPLLKDLRSGLSFADFMAIYEAARTRDEFRFVGVFEGDRCIALMGFRILFDYVHGKHLYVDDLVVAPEKRSSGIGASLLEFAEEEAHAQKCANLRLCTGNENKDAMRFYERNGWAMRSVVYKKKSGVKNK